MLQTPLTEIVHVKPLSRLSVPDVAEPLATNVVRGVAEQVTVAVRMPTLQVPPKEMTSETLAVAGLLVVPDAEPVVQVMVTAP